MSDCVFCKIVAGQIPSTKVFEDEHTLAFMDIGHVNPGHTLVAVKKHAANVFELEEAQAEALARAILRISKALNKAFAPEGLSVYQANGQAAGQTVFHYHVHLLPRHAGDGMELTWPVKNPPREKLEGYAGKIRQALGGEKRG
jgi:histidine triad (HIT) family protein